MRDALGVFAAADAEMADLARRAQQLDEEVAAVAERYDQLQRQLEATGLVTTDDGEHDEDAMDRLAPHAASGWLALAAIGARACAAVGRARPEPLQQAGYAGYGIDRSDPTPGTARRTP